MTLNTCSKCLLTMALVLVWAPACKRGKGPIMPEEQTEFHDQESSATISSEMPIDQVESQDVVLGKPTREDSHDSTQDNVPAGSDQQTPPATGTPSPGTPNPTPTPPAPPPPPFYPASCAAIKKAQPNAASGIFKIYLNAELETRSAIDASCDMTEDGGGWTLLLNYSHKGNTNPSLSIRSSDLPLLGDDTLGLDESSLGKNWGHAGNAMLGLFPIKELRFYCRSSQNSRVIHFKTDDANCIAAAQTGSGSCLNVPAGFVKLTGHTGILPAAMDRARTNALDLALTRDTFSESVAGDDISWSIRGNNSNAWECDFGSDNSNQDTIHRVWFR